MSKQEVRRAVIREWMALPRDKRQTKEQTAEFATKAVQSRELPRSRRDPHRGDDGLVATSDWEAVTPWACARAR